MAIMLRHINEPLPPACEVADVDPEISEWIERLTAKDPERSAAGRRPTRGRSSRRS